MRVHVVQLSYGDDESLAATLGLVADAVARARTAG